ncbi:MAG: polyamine ABC transporter substrate-binding protein [Deltaproteobacteria bacterium]|nr:polyamine ABC transporter substrate-binding protein [Deltaproteobacteria bacterium]
MKTVTSHILIILFLLVRAVTVLPAGAAENPTPDAARSPALLRMALDATAIGTLDPHFAAATEDRALVDMIFNGLVRYRPGNISSFEPDLAESLPASQIEGEKQSWTFRLRKGVLFHPHPDWGACELTAEDVVYSLRKSSDPGRSAYAGEYTGMSFEKLDRYTVRIVLDRPLSMNLFLPKVCNYAGGFIVSRKAVESLGDKAFGHRPLGTGPFVFERCDPGKEVLLSANGSYFRGRPRLDAVRVLFRPDLQERERGLIDGKWDVITGSFESGWLERMSGVKDVAVDVFGVGEVITIHFNTSRKPLDDIRVRRAIAHALNREEFLKVFGHRVCGNVYSPVPAAFLPGGLTEQEVRRLGLDYPADPAKAGELLAEAGYPAGFSLEVVASERREYLDNYQSLKRQLEKVGIRVLIKVVDHSTMHKLIRRDVNPIVVYVAWRPNADVYLSRFFHSDSIVGKGARPDTNFSHYDRIDRLIEAARLEVNTEKQIRLWKHAQIKILEDMAALPLHYHNLVYGRRADLEYGHELVSTMALYPQITEKTRIRRD